ncbi:MAG: hypothetical protein WCV85_00845 [Patescibacteria group bacterium]
MQDRPAIPTPHPRPLRLFFFWSGVIATICYRAIIFFSDANPALLKGSWYIGTVGFIIYFAHRFQIAQRRSMVLQKYNLAQKVPQLAELSAEERQAMTYVFQTLGSSREKWNYILIFVSSGVALLAGVYLDFLR